MTDRKKDNKALLAFLLCCLIAFLLIICISSCVVTKKQKREFCKTCTLSESIKDSTSVKVKDREVKVYIHDTVKTQLPNPCAALCDSVGKLKKFDQIIPGKKKGTSTRLFTRNDSLLVETLLDSLQASAHVKDSLISHYRETVREVPARCEKRHITDNEIFWIKTGRSLTWLLVGYILLRLLKLYLKKTFPMLARFIP